jgi:cytochrome c oxidase assembly protein subunit 15
MGVTTPAPVGTERLTWVRRWGWASLIANIGLVVTGGAVRLTGSGLGCPTWPRCTEESFTPRGAMDIHKAIEFGNRTLTFVLVAIAVGTYLAARRSGRRDLTRLAVVLALGIPAQAVIGGVTVLTDLNPWVVSLHLMCSLGIVALAVLFLRRVDRPHAVALSDAATWLAWSAYAAAWGVLYVGTVVTGSGPHAGDADARRNGLDPLQVSQLHADLVFLLLGLSLALALVLRPTGGPAFRAAAAVVVVEIAQGAVGFVQYFTDLPELLVGLHMLGAAVLVAVLTRALLETRDDVHRVRK